MQPLCGHVQDSPEEIAADPRWSEIAGSIQTRADDLDGRRFAPPVVQQIAQDCCGHAVRSAAFATAAANGTPIPVPSALALYAGGRKLPLEDKGASLRRMLAWAAKNGIVSEERWPEIPESVNAVPPLDVFEHGQEVPLVKWYTIDTGAALGDGIISALRRKRFPVIAMPVDEAFAALADGVYSARGGALLGYHAMCVVGFVSELDAFILMNSWGLGFGDNGFALVARKLLCELATDCVVIDMVPGGAT